MNRSMVPAFPRPASQSPSGNYAPQDGATLREYLTGQALIGVMAANAGGNPDYELVASHAVVLADLTLIALDRVTHEDAVKRVAEVRAIHPLTLDPEREKLPEDEKEPAAAALQGGGKLPPQVADPTSAPVMTQAIGQKAPPPTPLGPEYEQPQRDAKTTSKTKT